MKPIIVIKRDTVRRKEFDEKRIISAVEAAMKDINYKDSKLAENVSKTVESSLRSDNLYEVSILEIEDRVIQTLEELAPAVAKSYTEFRDLRTIEREKDGELMQAIKALGISTNRDNANVGNNFSSKLLNIASAANKRYNLLMMPAKLRNLFERGDLYYHDLDSYNLTINCLQVDAGEKLEKGFNTGYGYIRQPQGIGAAAALICILIQSVQNDQFGGVSISDFDTDLAPYVNKTREKIKSTLPDLNEETVERMVEKATRQAMQGVVYNLNTMHSRCGSQVPFSSVNVALFPELEGQEKKDAALVCRLFLEEYEKGLGKGEQPIFPSILFRVKEGFNANPEDEFYDLRLLAERVTSKRMNPTYMFVDSPANEQVLKDGCKPTTMG